MAALRGMACCGSRSVLHEFVLHGDAGRIYLLVFTSCLPQQGCAGEGLERLSRNMPAFPHLLARKHEGVGIGGAFV